MRSGSLGSGREGEEGGCNPEETGHHASAADEQRCGEQLQEPQRDIWFVYTSFI